MYFIFFAEHRVEVTLLKRISKNILLLSKQQVKQGILKRE